MPRVSVDLDKDLKKTLEKRAKTNLFSLKEQIEDILRRSAVNQAKKKSPYDAKVDDKLVSLFSRHKTGPKRRKK
ncbi:MAG: hypothetical protein AABY32_02730 [Nanoarchaeota archaeon]